MKKIKFLTPAQQARFGEWAKTWIGIGLSTEPADFDAATAAALRGYELANLKRPMVVLRVSSPYAATVGGAMAWLYLKAIKDKLPAQVWDQVGAQVRDQVWDQVGAQVGAQVRAQVWDQVGAQVRDQVGAQVRAQVGAQVWDQVVAQVRAQVWDQVGAQVRAQVGAQVLDQVGAQVGAQVWDQVGAQVWDQVGAQVRAQVWDQVVAQVGAQVRAQVWDQVGAQVGGVAKDGLNNDFGGSLWNAGFCAWISFFRDVCCLKLKVLKNFKVNETLAKSCGWVWWHQNVLAISDRAEIINRDEQNRLHCTNGPSVKYRDGWAMYHIHGVRVPAKVVMAPATLTVKEIETEKNAEIRRVMIERYGQDKFLVDSVAKQIHSDDFGTLFRKDIPGDEPLVMVKVVNSTPEPDGSFKDYFLRVPPTMERARQAVAWTFGLEESAYEPAMQT
jgi:hypothetical protein